jgi:hypothetical protein
MQRFPEAVNALNRIRRISRQGLSVAVCYRHRGGAHQRAVARRLAGVLVQVAGGGQRAPSAKTAN